MVNVESVIVACDAIAANFGSLKQQAPAIVRAAEVATTTLVAGGKVIFCGNGGSAADSQHLAAELMGRYKRDRAPMAALALTVDTSALTAIANDYDYDQVFARQLRGIGRNGDVLFALSTSGNSANVITALAVAREMGVITIGLTGADGGKMKDACDFCILVPSSETNHIQEMHIAVGHMICGLIEDAMC